MAITEGSYAARILHALQEGRWISLSELHRRAGLSTSFNARITQLRKEGWKIEHQTVKGKERSTLAQQYRLMRPWPVAVLPSLGTEPKLPRQPLDRDKIPRTEEHRHRIYMVNEQNKLLLMATAPTKEAAGVEIYELGLSGVLEKACIGWLDTYGEPDNEKSPGLWIVNPWDAKTI